MCIFGTALANTSGSILVSKVPVTHVQMSLLIKLPVIQHAPDEPPEPDWSLLQNKKPLSSFTHPELECRVVALETGLSHAHSLVIVFRVINEQANAQLLLQNLGMEKMNESLQQKEKSKNKDHTILKMFPGGKGRHLTDSEMVKAKRDQEQEKSKRKCPRRTGRRL